MELVAGIALGLLIGGIAGFWTGFIFLKKQLPDLPRPEVKVENHNEIVVPQKPVVEQRTALERQTDSTAEFISGL